VFGGTLPNGERFSWGYWAKPTATVNQTWLTGFNGLATSSLSGNFMTTTVKAFFSTAVTYDTSTSYYYNGGNDAALVAGGSGTTITAGSSSTVSLPDQLAIVVTQNTGIPGRSNRGRSFLPPVVVGGLAAGGVLLNSFQSGLCNAYAAMLSAIKDDPTNPAQPVVVSRHLGATQAITAVSIDSRFDVHRSRAMSESGITRVSANVT
jgi:hypothetical protein